MRPAVFLDRDGTIIEEVGYLSDISQIKIINGAIEAIKKLKKNNYLVIITTNQSGIARGFFSEEKLQKIHAYLDEILKGVGANIDDWLYCPHHIDGVVEPYNIECDCRKPRIGMIKRALDKFEIDLSKSFVIGDSVRDVLLGINSGIKPVLVLTGYGIKSLFDLIKEPNHMEKFHVVRDILDASRLICGY